MEQVTAAYTSDGAIEVSNELGERMRIPFSDVREQEPHTQFKLTLEDYEGETFTHRLDFALPEETGSEWVRLCAWAGIDPAQPADLRGEVVPISRPVHDRIGAGKSIDVPPVMGGLNPAVYRLKRAGHKLRHDDTAQTVGHYAGKTFPWWGTVLGVLLSMGMLLLSHSTFQAADSLLVRVPWAVVLAVAIVGGAASITLGLYYWGRACSWRDFLSNISRRSGARLGGWATGVARKVVSLS